MTTSKDDERQRQVEHDAAVAAGKDPEDFRRNDKGEILCNVMAEMTYAAETIENEEVWRLSERYGVGPEQEEQIVTYTYNFEVAESKVGPFMTALRKIGCKDINNHGCINANGIPEDLD